MVLVVVVEVVVVVVLVGGAVVTVVVVGGWVVVVGGTVVVVVVVGGTVVVVVEVVVVVDVVVVGGTVVLVVVVVGGGWHDNSIVPSKDDWPCPPNVTQTVNTSAITNGAPTVTAPGSRSTSCSTDASAPDSIVTTVPGCTDELLTIVNVGAHVSLGAGDGPSNTKWVVPGVSSYQPNGIGIWWVAAAASCSGTRSSSRTTVVVVRVLRNIKVPS